MDWAVRLRRFAGAWRGAALALALALVLAGERAAAQPSGFTPATPVVVDPDYEALFRQVLRDPSNLDLSFRFAEAATRRGDYEAAIGALERIVFYNPNLPRVRLEPLY